ncbi:hypothetical protein [Haladaptatus caseinilyticus]|uniref:hypothetical protein n=1 Tax=Haladaptatus caseinilyticus TaxID=2993314 RepID=UPI00224AD931|nr:hypothetical protein [Haladaptatus caseinilyticus]
MNGIQTSQSTTLSTTQTTDNAAPERACVHSFGEDGTDDKRIIRLVADCAGYLGKEAGDTVPVNEVRLQAEANGYTEDEFYQILDESGAIGKDRFVVPERDGSIFGELWEPHTTFFEKAQADARGEPQAQYRENTPRKYPNCLPPANPYKITSRLNGYTWVQASNGYLKMDKDVHTQQSVKRRHGRTKDVERYCIENFENLTTVWLTFKIPEKTVGGSWRNPIAHIREFEQGYDSVYSSLYHRLKTRDDYEYAGVRLFASRRTGYTHMHVALWVNAELSREYFEPVVDNFVNNAQTATMEDNPYDKAIRIRNVSDSDVQLEQSGNTDVDRKRGATTKLPSEVSGNLDVLNRYEDTTDSPSAELLHATALFEAGKKAWNPFGSFNEIADGMNTFTRKAERDAKNSDCLPPSDLSKEISSDCLIDYCNLNDLLSQISPASIPPANVSKPIQSSKLSPFD